VSIVECETEADQDIAIACAEGNIGCPFGKETFFCCGADSDFYVFRDCPYIQLSDLEMTSSKEKELQGGASGLTVKKVWRRRTTAGGSPCP
jgi:hypothetical protein